jgi:hypothetical protein
MEYYDKPAPALIQDIGEWESFFDIEMPTDLRDLHLESNGPVLYTEETGKELQFLSTSDAIEYYDAYKFKEFCGNAIPVSMDGCGNFVVYKLEQGKIKNVYAISSTNMGWHDAVYLKENVTELIKMEQNVEEILFS